MTITENGFTRNRLTWLAYCMLAYIAINQSILGPTMPFLRSELGLSYTQGGLIPAALAVGLICSGLAGDWLAHRFHRKVVFWGGSIGLILGVITLGWSHRFEWVLLAALAIGFGSSLTQVMIQALLSDEHGERRTVALTEANVAASFSATLTPFMVGGLSSIGLDWRVIPILPFALLILLVISFHRVTIPDAVVLHTESGSTRRRLSFSFWLFWVVLFFVVAAEMIIAVWATDYLANVGGMGGTQAAVAFSAFPAAMFIGRYLGSRLSHHWSNDALLVGALIVTLIGFPIFWLSRLPALSVLGLFLTGLGIANLYPMALSMMIGMAGSLTNAASARASLAVGTALLTAPLFLGWLSDQFTIEKAYGIVIILAVIALVIVLNKHSILKRTVLPQA